MNKYLIAIDLDGTLLQDWETVSKETIEYLKSLKAQGHEIVLATGRPFRSSEEYYDLLELKTPLINYNGGLVTNKSDLSFKGYSLTVNKEDVLHIFEHTRQYIHNAFGEVKDDIYLLENTTEIQPLLHNFNGARLFVGEFNKILNDDTNGFIIIANKGQGHHIEEFIQDNYKDKVLCRNWGNEYRYIIELFTPESNKGQALEYVANHLGFDRENIIAIGDGHNDIEMLEYAGTGVAMKNAHESLLPYADYITEYPNHEDGLIKFLQNFFEENKK
jgi:Cof subfamily protein (haloacid dehalogenase superfamily)